MFARGCSSRVVVLVAFVCLIASTMARAADRDYRLGLAPDGKIHLQYKGAAVCSWSPFAADLGWKMYAPTLGTSADRAVTFSMKIGNVAVAGDAKVVEKDGKAEAVWNFVPSADLTLNCLAMSTDIPIGVLAGGTWEADGKSGSFPQMLGAPGLFGGGSVRSFGMTFPNGQSVAFTFPEPTLVTMQDNRQYGGLTYSIRIGSKGLNFRVAAQERYTVTMTVTTPGGVSTYADHPVTLAADHEWVPLKTELDIEPGSALDLSSQGFIDGPCGARGRIIATPDGHFAFADDPKTPRRFYGINLCFGAQYLTKSQADQLLDRLVRLGYNTVRIHHYESGLTKPDWRPGFDWNADKVDALDYLIAGCSKRGLWLTTDLYVSRPVPGKQIGLTGDHPDPARFKSLVPVYEPAFKDWEAFTRKLLDRVNPYTGKRLADDPCLAWVSLINEGGGHDPKSPYWQTAWNKWLVEKYPNRDDLDTALGDLTDAEDPATNSVLFPSSLRTGSRRARVCQVFIADTERAMVQRMKSLLRDDLKCQALITDLNCPPHLLPMQATRNDTFDYVDDHFYVDHPMFSGATARFSPPSSCDNANPIREGATGGTTSAALRIWGKPFTITEFNYSGPGRYRGAGGLITGALASLQDWDGLWRFSYAHRDTDIFEAAPMDYFNLARDPLNLASDRATMMLFLRGDLKPAPNRVAVQMSRQDLTSPPARASLAHSSWLAWTTRIGCDITDQPTNGAVSIPVRAVGDRSLVSAALAQHQIKAPAAKGEIVRSETGEISLDKENGVFSVDTPRTAGGFAEAGHTIATSAGVQVDELTTPATVFVTSLDRKPIRDSSRLLVTHLTDLQNTGIRYSETARQTLEEWGMLPHLVLDGSARVRVTLADPAHYDVWSLSTSGRRMEKLATTVEKDGLVFSPRVRRPQGATMLYEIVKAVPTGK